MTENEKNLVAQNLVKSEVKASEPLYRKWWVWVIGAAVVINVFGNTSGDTKEKAEPSVAAVASAAPVVVETPENTWATWSVENSTNWSLLTDTLTSAEDCSNFGPAEMLACVDQIFSDALYYGNLITPMPDVDAQATFRSWLSNVESAQDAWRSGDYDSASTYLNRAAEDINDLSGYIENAA